MSASLYLADLPQADFETAAAGFILTSLEQSDLSANTASLFLSGGSTPGPIYEALSKTEFPWHNVNIGLVDERWVPETDKGSNAALIRRTLLKNAAKAANFTPMKTQHVLASQGQLDVEALYEPLFNAPAVAVLGMGTDGHVCSWFPKAVGLEPAVNPENPNYVQAVTPKPSDVTGPYLDRMTLTLTALRHCQKILLLISGQEKKKLLESVMTSHANDLPVTHLLVMAATLPDNPLTILHAA